MNRLPSLLTSPPKTPEDGSTCSKENAPELTESLKVLTANDESVMLQGAPAESG